MSNFVSDVPQFGQGIAADAVQKWSEQFAALKKKYRNAMKRRLGQFLYNAKSYMNYQGSSEDLTKPIFKRVFKDAVFIPAHVSRFRKNGMALENVTSFMLHRPGTDPSSCVLEMIVAEFAQPGREASTHFITGQNGALVQMVDLTDIAWHTGSARYANHKSIGVEMEGPVGAPISDQLYRVTASLIARVHLMSGMPIDKEHVIEHRQVLPATKLDVGLPLDINRMVREALALVPTYNKSDLFKAPFGIEQTISAIANEFTALNATAGISGLSLAQTQVMNGNIVAMQRSAQLGAMTRSDLNSAAAIQAQQIADQEAAQLAIQMSLSGLDVRGTPQENVDGLLFDPEQGVFNDKEPT